MLGAATELSRREPDYLAATLALAVLGGNTLTARLLKRIREELSLTYDITAGSGDASFGEAPWTVRMSVEEPKNIKAALAETHTILDRFYQDGITRAELETEVNYLCDVQKLALSNMIAIAKSIGARSARKLNLAGIDQYRDKLRAITLEEVNAAIRKYFNPAKLVTVVAGTVDAGTLQDP